jgi:hypothetical protein
MATGIGCVAVRAAGQPLPLQPRSGTALLAFAHRTADEIAIEAMRGVFGNTILEIGERGTLLNNVAVTIPSVRSQLVGVHL